MNTDRIRCTEAIEKLPLFVGGDLDPEIQAAVRAHLEGCRSCAVRAGSANRGRRALLDALLERGNQGAQPDLWTGIRATLDREGRIRGADAPSWSRDGLAGSPLPIHAAERHAAERHAAERLHLAGRPAAGRRWMPRVLAPLAAAAAVLLALQAGGFLTPGSGPEPLASAPLVRPHADPGILVEHTAAGAGVVPVSLAEIERAPSAGFLRQVSAEEAAADQTLLPFRRPVERRSLGDTGISLTGYR